MALYRDLAPETDIIKNMKQVVSSGMWSGGTGTLTTFFTGSAQSSSNGQYYYDVYKTDPASDTEAEVQFAVTYGHVEGSGSSGNVGTATGNRSTAAIAGQFAGVLLGPGTSKFTFTPSKIKKDFYAISINRNRIREKADPGNWELKLVKGAKTTHLIDDSGATTNPSVGAGGRVFNIVSGSIATGTAVIETAAASETSTGCPGIFYPDLGVFILNADWLDAAGNLALATSKTEGSVTPHGNNAQRLLDAVDTGASFVSRREENISSTHYFCRVNNKEFNFSTNPTFFTGSDGSLTIPSFFKDPKTYITTVGLYNKSNELLAVAKLSKPLLKSYAREAIIKVKLDF